MKEIFNEINILPEYYKEYYIIINNKIDNNLFKINKNLNHKLFNKWEYGLHVYEFLEQKNLLFS